MARKKLPSVTKEFSFDATLFDIGGDLKDQAIKILEESAEVFGAVQLYTLANIKDSVEQVDLKWDILDEAADTIQATLNLLYRLGFDKFDLREAMERCRERNEAKGRI